MGSGERRRRILAGAWCLLAACIDQAHSADVPPELAPRVAVAGGVKATSTSTSVAPGALEGKAALTSTLTPVSVPVQEAPRYDVDSFFDAKDEPVRAALSQGTPARIERGRGGRSLGFKVTLDNGQKGYFKGEQVFSAANWFGEVASFHLDRMLGLGRVPTIVSRQFPWSRLVMAAGNDPRRSEIIVRNGQVRGAFVAWVPDNLRPLQQAEGWERWIRVKVWPRTAVSPFQRPAVWKRELDVAARLGAEWRDKDERLRRRNLKPEPDREDRPAELSDLVVFDYLTRNIDRWGGGNANVLTRGDKGPLLFLDNGASFEPGEARPSLMEARLHALQRVRRRTVAAVRAFDLNKFEARLTTEPVQPVLTRAQLHGLEQRRKGLLQWIAALEAEHGEAIWAWE